MHSRICRCAWGSFSLTFAVWSRRCSCADKRGDSSGYRPQQQNRSAILLARSGGTRLPRSDGALPKASAMVAAVPLAPHTALKAGPQQACVCRSSGSPRPNLSVHSRRCIATSSSCVSMSGSCAALATPGAARRRLGTAARAAADAGAASPGDDMVEFEDDEAGELEDLDDPHAGHAFLHDFCMCIPYGLILAVAGIVALCCHGTNTGLTLLGGGIVTEMLASLSLKNWKLRRDSRLFTAGTAGVALVMTVSMWQRATSGLAAIAVRSLSSLSALLLLFLVYNVAAGGNPPKKDDATEEVGGVAEEAAALAPST